MGVTFNGHPPAGTRQYAAAADLRHGDRVPFADETGTLRWLTVDTIEIADHGIGWYVNFAEDDMTIRAGHGTRLDTIRPHQQAA